MIFKDKLLVDSPIISVVVPTYNQEKYIAETLDSILAQLIDIPYEIVIAEDCGSDNTREICLDYQTRFPEKIVFISNDQNQGLLKNLFDVLFTNARGKYIALCAGDDVWINKHKLNKQFDLLKNNKNVSAVHTGYNKFYEATNKYIPIVNWNSPLLVKSGAEAIKDVVLEHFSTFPVASSMMFRKATIDKYQKDNANLIYDKNAQGEGLILFSFNALEGIYAFIPEVMVNYRIREGSMCHIIDEKKQLIFNIKYRILQKTLIVKTLLNDKALIKRVNRTFLSLYLESINNNCEETFFEQYNSYKKNSEKNIPLYVRFTISFISLNSLNKFIYKFILGGFLKLKCALIS